MQGSKKLNYSKHRKGFNLLRKPLCFHCFFFNLSWANFLDIFTLLFPRQPFHIFPCYSLSLWAPC